jgi:hypothetical protein
MAHVRKRPMNIPGIAIWKIGVPGREDGFPKCWEFWGFNWKITAKLLQLREIGVYHTATAA